MNCLRDYVLVRWCGESNTPPSNLYLNDLPGITLKGLMDISTAEQATFKAAWDAIQTRAERRFNLDVRQKLGARWKPKNLMQSINLGKVQDTTATISLGGANDIRGFEVELDCDAGDDYMNSALYELHLQALYIFAAETTTIGTIRVKVYDKDTTLLLHTESFTSVGFTVNQWTKLDINYNFIQDRSVNDHEFFNSTDQYIITVELSTALTSRDITVVPDDTCGCCGFRTYPGTQTGVAYAADPVTSSALTRTTPLGGMTAIIGSRCSWHRLVCSNKDIFATAWWYLLGVETMREALGSDRLNRYTTIDRKKLGELKNMYEVEYMGGEANGIAIEGALAQAVDTIDLDCSDCCLECGGQGIMIKESVL